MTYLVGLIIAFAFFGGLELVWRLVGLPLSIFGALGAVLRQTDEPRLQRRQALTLLLLVIGGGMAVVGAILLAQAVFTRIVFSALGGGVFILTIAGYVGNRTMRAIGRSALKQQAGPPRT
jgi:hypothetical protein